MSSPAPTLPLVNGARIPHLGLGTWPLDDAAAEKAVATAFEAAKVKKKKDKKKDPR